VGEFLLAISFKNVENHFLGLLHMFMDQILIVIEGFYGMNWLVCVVGGTYHGASGRLQCHALS
jgi:hypothetical protein